MRGYHQNADMTNSRSHSLLSAFRGPSHKTGRMVYILISGAIQSKSDFVALPRLPSEIAVASVVMQCTVTVHED
jgi:hypothetical protein